MYATYKSYTYPFRHTDEKTKQLVWQKGRVISGYDPQIWRYDACGKPIRYSDHGNENSEFGWEIDHILPEAKGGQTVLSNLQPLYWKTNRQKSDVYPWACPRA